MEIATRVFTVYVHDINKIKKLKNQITALKTTQTLTITIIFRTNKLLSFTNFVIKRANFSHNPLSFADSFSFQWTDNTVNLETGLNALLNVTEEWKPELGNVTTPLLSMVVKIVKERNLKVRSATTTTV